MFLCVGNSLHAQDGTELLDAADRFAVPDTLLGVDAPHDPYVPLVSALGGDSVRYCEGAPCVGRVEDRRPDGSLLHSGYYGDGRLITYRNFHPSGAVEREFTVKSNTRSLLRTWFPNGVLRSEALFVEGTSRALSEYYTNGQLRCREERHPDLPCYLVMDLYAPDGRPISTLRIADKKRLTFAQRAYWPNGKVMLSGLAQFDPRRYDTRRIGTWTSYSEEGAPSREERYIDGRVHEVAVVAR